MRRRSAPSSPAAVIQFLCRRYRDGSAAPARVDRRLIRPRSGRIGRFRDSSRPDRTGRRRAAGCGILGVRAREKGITLVAPPEGESQLAIAEFRRVLQILLNLVGTPSAIRPTRAVICSTGSAAVRLTVADRGTGWAKNSRNAVRKNSARRSGDGGLPRSHLAAYCAGDGRRSPVESAPGQGARLRFRFLRRTPAPNAALGD